jgi:PAS domain S-box-containing protein
LGTPVPRLTALRDASVRTRILFACLVMFVPFALGSGWLTYTVTRSALEARITGELHNATAVVTKMVQTAVDVSIRNYLRSVAEANRAIVADLHARARRGEFSDAEARRRATAALLSQTIGRTGYLYCVDSQGTAPVHPDPAVRGRNFAAVDFVVEQVRRKEGYLEYEWRNPGEAAARPKALAMAYFEPWDWIISASAYRAEFEALVNVEDFRDSVESLRFVGSGYSYVVALDGTVVIHPVLPRGTDVREISEEGETAFLEEMLAKRRGEITYQWKNPGESTARRKIVVYDFVPGVNWLVASSAYVDEIFAPLDALRSRALWVALLCLGVGAAAAIRISDSITRPIRRLTARLAGGVAAEAPPATRDEVQQLEAHFDRYLEELERESGERRLVERRLRSSEERYRALMASAPDPVMVVDLDGAVSYLNHAFVRTFGWELEDFRGEAAHAFVPPEERARTRRCMHQLLGDETISAEESLRCTRSGALRTVSVSGGPFRDGAGTIAGAVLILRDATEFKLLERTVIDADERERIRIGQDLHDDLVPHLIGIDVMCKVLRRRQQANAATAGEQAEKIQRVVAEAIRKTRALSRGLAPVHLVEDGLEVGLEQLTDTVEAVFGVPCTMDWDAVAAFETTTAVHIYRIVQEALHNAVKHAKPRQLQVRARRRGEDLVVEVSDDGTGLGGSEGGRGMGRKIMEFRANIIGGQLAVESRPGRGTVVRLAVQSRAPAPPAGRGEEGQP